MILPTNHFPSAAFSCCAFVNCRQVNNLLNMSVALTFSPCVSLTFLLSLGIELTENQCQSVCVRPSYSHGAPWPCTWNFIKAPRCAPSLGPHGLSWSVYSGVVCISCVFCVFSTYLPLRTPQRWKGWEGGDMDVWVEENDLSRGHLGPTTGNRG